MYRICMSADLCPSLHKTCESADYTESRNMNVASRWPWSVDYTPESASYQPPASAAAAFSLFWSFLLLPAPFYVSSLLPSALSSALFCRLLFLSFLSFFFLHNTSHLLFFLLTLFFHLFSQSGQLFFTREQDTTLHIWLPCGVFVAAAGGFNRDWSQLLRDFSPSWQKGSPWIAEMPGVACCWLRLHGRSRSRELPCQQSVELLLLPLLLLRQVDLLIEWPGPVEHCVQRVS